MRHGEPDVAMLSKMKIKSKEFSKCLNIYNHSGISAASTPEVSKVEKFNQFRAVVASDLNRSIASASLLTSHQSLIIDPLFREVEGAYFRIPFLRLSVKTWSNIFILLWYIGLFEIKHSIKLAKLRAKRCAEKLISLAEKYDKVLFVGHGFINTYIAQELKFLGWDGPKVPSRDYWDYGVYKKTS